MKETEANKNNDSSPSAYEVFLAERKNLLDTAKEAASKYAKAIITLSSGALLLSLNFMKDLAPEPKVETFFYLIGSWIAFSSSLLMVVISFLLATFAFNKQVTISEKFLLHSPEGENNTKPDSNPYNFWIKTLNIASLIAFIFGLYYVVLFSINNLPQTPK